MNDMIVGMENLPNVFINRIQLIQDQETSNIKVVLMMYDDMENRSWKGRNLGIKVKIVFESRPPQIQALNEGSKSLFEYNPILASYSTEPFDTYVISLDEFSVSGNPSKYQSFVKIIEYAKPLRENLNVYAACFIDGLNFNNPMFDKFYGPMAAEQIFVGGQLNTLSNYFYYPDTNEEYGGPVHQKPDGSFMEGSEHSDKPHKAVVLVSEENYKIQAYNVDFSVSNEVFAGRNVGNVSVRPTDVLTDVPDDIGPDVFSPITAVAPTGVPTPEAQPGRTGVVNIEDPNVPDSTPDRIY